MIEITHESAETLRELLGGDCPLFAEQRAGDGWTETDLLALYRVLDEKAERWNVRHSAPLFARSYRHD